MTTRYKKVSDKHYMITYALPGTKFIEVKGEPVNICGMEGIDLFVHRVGKGRFHVSEGRTGCWFAASNTKARVISAAIEKVKENPNPRKAVFSCIRYALQQYPLSPRYEKVTTCQK